MDGELHTSARAQGTPELALAPHETARIADAPAAAEPRQPEAAPAGQGAADACTAPHVADAELEPLLAAARERRAGYDDMRLPVVSLVVLGLLVALAWLV
jgi:hypothetical protein